MKVEPSYAVAGRAPDAAKRYRDLSRAVWLIVSLGVALRLWHYALNPAVWLDEAALLINVVELDFAQLLGPLLVHEAAPPLFLWLEKAIAVGFDDGQRVLRLPALIAGCATVVVMAPLARRVLEPAAAPVAVALIAFSDRLIWHSVEAKPYAIDAWVAATVACVFVAVPPHPRVRTAVAAIALAPVLIWLSYPGGFVCGGVIIGVLLRDLVVRSGARTWPWVVLLAATVVVAFIALLVGPATAQATSELRSNWTSSFPDSARMWTVPWWVVRQTMGVHDYAFRPIGGVLLVSSIVGAWSLYARGRASVLAVLLAPMALAAVAALVHRYPYGGSRLLVFAAPGLAMISAEGLLRCWRSARRLSSRWRAPAQAAVMVAILSPLVLASVRAVAPRSRPDTAGAADYVRAQRHATDFVASARWEYRFYFRDLGTRFVFLEAGIPLPAVDRIWLVIHDDTAARRLSMCEGYAGEARSPASVSDRDGVLVCLLVTSLDGSVGPA